MIAAGRGNVVNVSSGLGRRGAPQWGPYVTSKWALEGMTRTQAAELEDHGITVNAVDPGGRVETGFWDHLPADERDRILDPDVMNDAATLLLAQDPGGVTGESMPADEWERQLE
jgi:3-oxoacyl-[acyl-carrier protein] reductase